MDYAVCSALSSTSNTILDSLTIPLWRNKGVSLLAQIYMARRRRHVPSLPHFRILAELKLDHPAISHYIFMLEPVLAPLLAVDLYALYVHSLLETGGLNSKRLVPVDRHVHVREPWRGEQVDRLCDDRINTKHLPQKPGVHCACIAVAGDAVSGVLETATLSISSYGDVGVLLLLGEAAGLRNALVLLVDVVE